MRNVSHELTSTNTLGVVALAEQTVDTANGESETSLGRTALSVLGTAGLAAGLASSHFDECLGFEIGWKRRVGSKDDD